jgi:hypothetical protein
MLVPGSSSKSKDLINGFPETSVQQAHFSIRIDWRVMSSKVN